jgi:hypothetical protein
MVVTVTVPPAITLATLSVVIVTSPVALMVPAETVADVKDPAVISPAVIVVTLATPVTSITPPERAEVASEPA